MQRGIRLRRRTGTVEDNCSTLLRKRLPHCVQYTSLPRLKLRRLAMSCLAASVRCATSPKYFAFVWARVALNRSLRAIASARFSSTRALARAASANQDAISKRIVMEPRHHAQVFHQLLAHVSIAVENRSSRAGWHGVPLLFLWISDVVSRVVCL